MADKEDLKGTDAVVSAPDAIETVMAGSVEAEAVIEAEAEETAPILADTPDTVVSDESSVETDTKAAPELADVLAEPLDSSASKKVLVTKAKPGPKPGLKSKSPKPPVAKIKAQSAAPLKGNAGKPDVSVKPSKVAKVVKKPVAPAFSPKAATQKAEVNTAFKKPVFAGLFTNFMLEETQMDMNTNFAGIQAAMTEAQAKAKAVFEKSTSALGEVTEFTKGNVEACVESGKILSEGLQGMGSELVSEGRASFEALTSDIKEMASAKSPTDFFKMQSDLVRKSFDNAVAYNSKNSEAMLKLFSDSFAPISGRMSIAMEKARSISL